MSFKIAWLKPTQKGKNLTFKHQYYFGQIMKKTRKNM